jgi:hypothetical protein
MSLENIKLQLDGKTIIIEKARIVDEELYRFFQQVDKSNRLETFSSLLKTGCVGVKRMHSGSELDYVEKKFDMMAQRFESMFDPQLKTSFFGRLVSLLQQYFNKGGNFEDLLQNGHFSKLRNEINDELQKLRNEITKKEITDEYEDKIPIKGYKFEDEVEVILSKIASRNIGDTVERTTNVVGNITSCFAGDFLFKFADNPFFITIETKDCQNLTYNAIIENLKKAMKNRNAKYGILIAKNKESLPLKIGWFNEYNQNMLVCALGSKQNSEFFNQIVPLAVQWAKLRMRKEIKFDEELVEKVEDGIKQIKEKLSRFGLIKTKCSNINKSTDEIYEIAQDLKEEIKILIERIQEAIVSLSGEDVDNNG